MANNAPIEKIVVTGGPCAGKTSVLNAIRDYYGDHVLLVPETATILLSGGFPQPGRDCEWSQTWQDIFQIAVTNTQLALEAIYEIEARRRGLTLLVLDRGLLDGAAYLTRGQHEYCVRFGLRREVIHDRYAAVIHLESLATAQPALYGSTNNACRYETLEQAQALEYAVRAAWAGHPYHTFLPSSVTLAEQIEMVKHLIEPYLMATVDI